MTVNRTDGRIAISTMLTADERMRVDAAGIGIYETRHCNDPKEVLSDIKARGAAAVLVSLRCCEGEQWADLARVIREIPRIPTFALLTGEHSTRAELLMRLGRDGVRDVIDVRTAAGWKVLRDVLTERCGDILEELALDRVERRGNRMSVECRVFFETLVHASRRVSSVRGLARELQILPSTLMSRFFRAGLPAPKRYLAMMRLCRAAYLFENGAFSIANVANHLEYSSPQSFGRHVKAIMRMTALEFRRTFSGQAMLDRFEAELIRPYERMFEEFHPLSMAKPGMPGKKITRAG